MYFMLVLHTWLEHMLTLLREYLFLSLLSFEWVV